MAKILTLELLESLYNELMRRTKEGVYSGEVLEQYACKVLANLHASKDPFCIYRQELSSQNDRKRRSNNPLDHVIRRLTEEIFAITTTNSYPVLLTPKLYVICVSLLSELSFGKLSPLFLDTYDGHADKFENDFKPLMLEMFTRRTPWWVLVKNLEYLVGNVGSGVSGAISSDRVRLEFEELSLVMGFERSSMGLVDFLPLAFAGFEPLKKGISEGRYLFGKSSGRDKSKAMSRKGPSLVGLGSIIEKAGIIDTFRSFKKTERAISSERQSYVLDTFALARVSIAALFKVFSRLWVESGRKGPVELDSGFKCMVEDFKASVATLLAGSEIFDSSENEENAKSKVNPQVVSQQIFELDGSLSSDIFTLENKASTYFPFHFLHIQVVSGLRSLMKSLSHFKGPDRELGGRSGLYDLVVAYLMRMLNQIEKILESRGLESVSHDKDKSSGSISRFNGYSELIPSETVLLVGVMSSYYTPCRSLFRKKLLDLCISQLRGSQRRKVSSPLFITSFTQFLDEGIDDDLDCDFLTESWDRIFREIIFPGLLDSYKIDLFVSMLSSKGVIGSLSKINMEAFLGKYLGVFTRVLAYHPDLAAKPIIIFIMNCIKGLKSQMPGFNWLPSWTKIILSVICTPLMTFFPQKVNCSINDIKAAISPIKPNGRILNHLSVLAYPKIHAECRKKSRPDLISIISDLPTSLLLVSIYNSNHAGSKRLHALTVLNACNRFIDLLVDDLIGSLRDYKRHTEDGNCVSVEEPVNRLERKNITRLTCEILQDFPYLFHQGAKYSQEIYEKIVKTLVFLITEFDELLFQDEVFEAILSSLRLEFHSNVIIISPVCWAIGEVFSSRAGTSLLEGHEDKVLTLIDSLEQLLEGCCSRCTQVYNELSRKGCNSETDSESNSGAVDEVSSDYSNSSYSSFISDSSVEINHVASEDEFEENLDYFMATGGGEFAKGGAGEGATVAAHSGHFVNVEYACENLGKNTIDFLEDDSKDEIRYLDNIYLIETIVSALCKIGLSSRQSKSRITRLIEACSRKLQVGPFETDGFQADHHSFAQQDQLLQYARFILSRKVNICIKSLGQSSMFSSALHKSTDLPSVLHGNRSLGSILL